MSENPSGSDAFWAKTAASKGRELVDPALELRAGGEGVFLPLVEVREVALEPEPISRIPRTRPPIIGAINLRGRVVALVELAGLLGRAPVTQDPAASRVVLLEGGAVALRVEEVVGIAERHGAADGAPLATAWILERVEKMLSPGEGAMDYLDGRKDGG